MSASENEDGSSSDYVLFHLLTAKAFQNQVMFVMVLLYQCLIFLLFVICFHDMNNILMHAT